MASERLNVFKLATDKLVYVTKISEEIVVVMQQWRLFSSLVWTEQTSLLHDDNYFFTDFRNVYEFVRGEFEYVESFASHREFRSVDTLDESLDFIERVTLCSE